MHHMSWPFPMLRRGVGETKSRRRAARIPSRKKGAPMVLSSFLNMVKPRRREAGSGRVPLRIRPP